MSVTPDACRAPTPCPLENKGAVLIVGNFLGGILGSRGVCEDLAARLREAGWHVRTTSDRVGRVRRLAQMLTSAWSWRREYAVCQVDVFSGPSFLWAAAVSYLLRWLKKTFILTLHGGKLPQFSLEWPRLVRSVLAGADVVTAPSAYLVREMKPYRPEIVLLPNALEISAYPFVLRSRPRPSLVWLRAFHETYNPSLAVEVLGLISREYPDASLMMIGYDKGDGSLQRVMDTASRLGVTDRLRVVPGIAKNRVGVTLSEADVFLNTTNVDNTPVSVIEAMACGLCIVSTNVGGIPDLVEDGRDGVLVPPSSPDAMADGVRRIVGDPSFAARLSANARRKAEQHDWSVLLPKWEGLLRSVLVHA